MHNDCRWTCQCSARNTRLHPWMTVQMLDTTSTGLLCSTFHCHFPHPALTSLCYLFGPGRTPLHRREIQSEEYSYWSLTHASLCKWYLTEILLALLICILSRASVTPTNRYCLFSFFGSTCSHMSHHLKRPLGSSSRLFSHLLQSWDSHVCRAWQVLLVLELAFPGLYSTILLCTSG